MANQSEQQMEAIETPHDHDVLSGRGNFVNYHAGNEHFRALVRKHKVAYVACPKPQKGKFSQMIVDEIKRRNPPGRFLKQDPKTKLWYDIGEKKSLDKTRQALREGAPDIQKELNGEPSTDDTAADLVRRSSATGGMQPPYSTSLNVSGHSTGYVTPGSLNVSAHSTGYTGSGSLNVSGHGTGFVGQPATVSRDVSAQTFGGMPPAPAAVALNISQHSTDASLVQQQQVMMNNQQQQALLNNQMLNLSGHQPFQQQQQNISMLAQQANFGMMYPHQQQGFHQIAAMQSGISIPPQSNVQQSAFNNYQDKFACLDNPSIKVEPAPIDTKRYGMPMSQSVSDPPRYKEETDPVAPLRRERRQKGRREGYETQMSTGSLAMDNIFGNSLGQSFREKDPSKMSKYDSSVRSMMSLSVDGIAELDPNKLGELFDSSLQIGSSKKTSLRRMGSGDDLDKSGFEMSVNTLGDGISEFGDSMNMPNDMSFAGMSVFEEPEPIKERSS